MSHGEGDVPFDPALSPTLGLGFASMFSAPVPVADAVLADLTQVDPDDLLARRGRLADRSGPLMINTRAEVQPDEFSNHELVVKVPAGKRLLVEHLGVVATAASLPFATLVIVPSPQPEDPGELVAQLFAVSLGLNPMSARQFQGTQLTRLYVDGPKELLFILESSGQPGDTFPNFTFGVTGPLPTAWATLLLSGWVSDT